MCYSAQVWADYRSYCRRFGLTVGIRDFVDLFVRRETDPEAKVNIPKAMEAAFAADPQTEEERRIKAAINAFNAHETARIEQDLFRQRKRLADAERTLAGKPTKAAAESQRIASNKIESAMTRLTDLGRTELQDRDSRIYPGYYAPVMVMEAGRLVVKPMRYQCRPANKPAIYDRKYPGTYNARRDSLGGFWKDLFGYSHGLIVVNAFYENVNRAGERPENVVLEFRTRPAQDMLVACLYSRWTGKGEPDLWSFAAITDLPPPEVAGAGHDRCIIPIRLENVEAWLRPDPSNLAAQQAILEDRERPYYEHRLAA